METSVKIVTINVIGIAITAYCRFVHGKYAKY